MVVSMLLFLSGRFISQAWTFYKGSSVSCRWKRASWGKGNCYTIIVFTILEHLDTTSVDIHHKKWEAGNGHHDLGIDRDY